ncbi:class I SAM-dependent methyltransferase [Ovoidimarina sediminis]|uniref:class I SAM-dependent methyltransferase n=1 Tax=Ovoidimarina sediminis TaxID=3079856 RepID=UPI00290BD600|nr:class I SAM-dependent methyltransferase [Rhodophyticola sp. MJ-SS7]MDU8945829.1 class I SAM-dependent methyltransferase [Rhodophyticola sp. MJ-SS7]
MGIDAAIALQLIANRDLFKKRKSGLMLGRQSLRVPPKHRGRIRRAMRTAELSCDLEDLFQKDGYAETFTSAIGLPPLQALDASDYEGSNLVHDLNYPIGDDLRGRFDFILDGGTLEHVFNAPQALDNVFSMLSEGGVFISANGMTGWAGHGFYQFSPELVWRYWQDARGCEILQCTALPFHPGEKLRHVRDTGAGGARFRSRKLTGRWYLFYIVQKSATANTAPAITAPAQSDYQVRWQAPSEVHA